MRGAYDAGEFVAETRRLRKRVQTLEKALQAFIDAYGPIQMVVIDGKEYPAPVGVNIRLAVVKQAQEAMRDDKRKRKARE